MFKLIKDNFIPFLFLIIVVSLLIFPVWSHFYQIKELNRIKEIRLNGSNDMLVGASTLFAQNASVQLNFETFGSYASTSGNLSFQGELLPDGVTCGANDILKRTGANNWDCATDSTGTGLGAFEVRENSPISTTFRDGSIASLSFNDGAFNVTASGTEDVIIKLDYTNGPASLSQAATITGNWVNTDNPWADNEVVDAITISGGIIGANSISGLQTTTATLTFGDNGDNIVFDSNTWDITGAGVGSGFTQFTVDNLDFNGNSFTSTTGGITIAPNSSLLNITGAASISTNFEAVGYASASAFRGTAFSGDCDAATDTLNWDTTNGTFSCGTDDDIPEVGDFTNLVGGSGIDNNSGTLDFDATELEALTWGAGGNATNIWTYNLSAGDPTLTWTQSGASLSLNFETLGYASASRYFGGFSSHSFGGSIEPRVDGGGSLGTTALTWAQVVANKIKAFIRFILPLDSTPVEEGELAYNTASDSLDTYDGTAVRVLPTKNCFTIAYDTPSAVDQWPAKRFLDPFTFTEISPVASGTNSVSWNLYYGAPNSATTAVFPADHQASTSAYPVYKSTGLGAFTNYTPLDGNNLDLRITSASSKIEELRINVCGYYNH